MDAHVGEILDAIDALEIHDNTIVVFTHDNGPEATWPGKDHPVVARLLLYAHGRLTPVPFIVRWPGAFPVLSNEIVHEVDT